MHTVSKKWVKINKFGIILSTIAKQASEMKSKKKKIMLENHVPTSESKPDAER